MRFHNGLGQEIDQGGMDVFAHQYAEGRCDDREVSGRKILLVINRALRQYKSNKKRENSGESLRPSKVHSSYVGIAQQDRKHWRIRSKDGEQGIYLALIQCVDRAQRRER